MFAKIQIRRDEKAKWEDANPTLDNGEFGLEIETKKLKIGDGVTHWKDLGYIGGEYVHLEGDETIEGIKTFTDEVSVKELILSNTDGVKIKNGINTFLRASEGGSVFISGYGDNRKIEFRPKGDSETDNVVIINSDGDIIGNNFIGIADRANKDSFNREITETYALKTDALIASGATETGWYKLWGNGFKEEGGTTQAGTLDVITFKNSFSDEKYTIIVNSYSPTEVTITKTGVKTFSIASSTSCAKSWEVKGF